MKIKFFFKNDAYQAYWIPPDFQIFFRILNSDYPPQLVPQNTGMV